MSKISELIGDPHYTCYKTSSSNANDNINNTISEFPCNAALKWTAKTWPEKEIKEKVLDTEKRLMKVAAKMAKNLNISNNAALEIMQSDTALDVFKNAVKIDTAECDKIMKNVDHPSQVINQEINRPSHYGSKSGKDVIDWCEDFGIMDNAYIFNIFKYLCRAGKKNNNSELQDALKARIYLNRYIEKLEKGN